MPVNPADSAVTMEPVEACQHMPGPDLGCEFFAAFNAAARQHIAAGLGLHTGKKAVLAGTLAFFGLISPLWHPGLFLFMSN